MNCFPNGQACCGIIPAVAAGKSGRVPGTQELVVHQHYVLVYDVTEGEVRVLNVVHTARHWPPSPGKQGRTIQEAPPLS